MDKDDQVNTLLLCMRIVMTDYKFVRIRLKGFFRPKPEEDYHVVVKNLAKENWRLIQLFAPGLGPYGRPVYYDLVFEKHVKQPS